MPSTVEQHLTFIASVYDVPDACNKAGRLLEDFNLASQATTIARNLSRGMRQKLALCCAYLYDPAALLFDEPLTGLDPHGIRTFKESVVQRARDGAAVIVSSHLLAMVEDICTHVLILANGTRKFSGSIAELRSRFTDEETDVSLENFFFRATDEEASCETPAAVC